MSRVRMRLTLPPGRAVAIVLASAIGSLTLVALGTTQLSWPWFSIWILTLLLLAVAGGSAWTRRLGLTPARAWIALLLGGATMNLHLYWIQLHRQRSERLDVTGVYLQAADGFTVGAGLRGLDVHLAGALTEQDRWSMRIAHDGGRFRVQALDGVDWLERKRGDGWTRLARVRRLAGGRSEWSPLWGDELSRDRRAMLVTEAGGREHRLELTDDGARGTLRWDGQRVRLSEASSPVLDRRLARRLRTGVPLDELTWEGAPDTITRKLVVTQVAPAITTPFGLLRWPRYRLASRDTTLRIGAVTPAGALATFEPGDTIRIGSRGRVWAFAARLAPPSRWRASDVVQLSFVQRPSSRGWPLPASDECTLDAACAVVSSHPLPPPVAYFDLSGAGLDTARYALLGRLDRPSPGIDSLRFVSDTAVLSIPYGEVRAVEARRLVPDARAGGYLLRVHRPEASDWGSLAWTVLGLTVFLLLCGRALRAGPRTRGWFEHANPHARAAWLIANVATVLLSVRLLLGLRVTYAAPFYDRGAATAVGLWLAVGTLLVLLAWWPVLWAAALPLVRRVGPGTAVLTGVVATAPLPDRRTTLRMLMPPLLVAIVLALSVLRVEDAIGAVFAVALALFAWMAVAVSEIARAPERLGDDAIALLTAETTATEDLRPTLALTAAIGLGITLASRAPYAMLAVLAAGGVAALIARVRSRGAARRALIPAAAGGAPPAEEHRPEHDPMPEPLRAEVVRAPVRRALGWGAVLVALVSVARIAELLQGPTLLFGIIVMLFLLAVRAGVLCARRLERREATASGGAALTGRALVRDRLALLSALMLPLGALAVAGMFDVGLALVVFVPLFLTVVIAAGAERMGRELLVAATILFVAASWAASSVLFPNVDALEREGRTDIERGTVLFAQLGGPVARLADLTEPTRVAVRRAIVRGLAARHPELLEQLLPSVGPSEARDEIIPSLEQAWGGRAYAASGWTGAGFARTAVLGRGVSAATSYAENTFAVYVLSEHGALGGLAVLALYATLAVAALWWALRARRMIVAVPARAAALAIVVGGTLLLVLPAAYVALSNLGIVPLTGQNMPFLGLNAWSDVVFVGAITSAMLAALAGLAATERSA